MSRTGAMFRSPLGLMLGNALQQGGQVTPFGQPGPSTPPGIPPANPLGLPAPSNLPAQQTPAEAMPNVPLPASQEQGMSRGQLIMGVLADALSGAMGRPGQFAAQMGRQQEQTRELAQEEARWHREQRRPIRTEVNNSYIEVDPTTGTSRVLYQGQPDASPMERDAAAWARMGPEQRAAYEQMKRAGAGDPDVVVTLPNQQIYAGPRSGLAAALTGGGAAAPAPTAPTAPVGRLTPVTEGGPTARPSGTFRR